MYNSKVQGKDSKAVATQGKVTAQNPTNQSQSTDELFYVPVDEVEKALSRFDFGIITPKYVLDTLQMSERIINRSRLPIDKQNVLTSSISILLSAVVASSRPAYTCSITGQKKVGYGNNAYPFEGRCSDEANNDYVIPARVLGVTPKQIAEAGGTEAYCKLMDADKNVANIREQLTAGRVEAFERGMERRLAKK